MKWLYRQLRKIRPTPAASALANLLGVERVYARSEAGQLFWVEPLSFLGGALIDEGVFEAELTRALRSLLRAGDTFIDAGANEGYFSVVASLCVENGKVVAIEPQRRLAPFIEENLRVNGCKNVSVHPVALGAAPGSLRLRLAPLARSGGSGARYRGHFSAGVEIAPMVTLDALTEELGDRRVRLIKIDCEGAELSILQGATKLLGQRRVDFLSVDYHMSIVGAEEACRIDELLRGFGYKASRVGAGSYFYHLAGLETELRALGTVEEVAPLSKEPAQRRASAVPATSLRP